ncbi:hypothetical protein D3C72_2070100 [compost metagenome]
MSLMVLTAVTMLSRELAMWLASCTVSWLRDSLACITSTAWRTPPCSRCSISLISLVLCWVRPASERTSSATTAKPRPCSPARAASMAALSASRLV